MKKKRRRRPIGRPSQYSLKTSAIICERLADGESLREICRDPKMPAPRTVFVWLNKHPDFVQQYTRAREAQADALFEDVLDIADDGRNDWMDRNVGSGETIRVVDHEHISRSKLRVDARKWMAGKLAPKKYGEKITQEMTGPNGGPIETRELSKNDAARIVVAALAQAMRDQQKT